MGAAGLLSLLACGAAVTAARQAPPRDALPPLSWPADSSAAAPVAPGIVHYTFVVRSQPWVIQILDVDLEACWSLVAVKAGDAAVGRETTSTLVARVDSFARARGGRVAGGVNADFFSFTPPGVPSGAAIRAGRVLAGPGDRPVFALDSAGRPWIGTLRLTGSVVFPGDTLLVDRWNRTSPAGLAWFDRGYGELMDTATGSLRLALSGSPRSRVVRVDSSGSAMTIPATGGVLSLGRQAPVALRRALTRAAAGAPLQARLRLDPFHPQEAIGGFPVLVRDSALADTLDRTGAATFAPVRHPRTIVGIGSRGRRVLLVTVDGRRDGYSAGMTLVEAARLLLGLGAHDALNLDGGGSTTLVVRLAGSASTGFAVANRPSDANGERPVANALAVVTGCRGREVRP